MKLRILVGAAILVGVALVPTAAWAKGAKGVTITGPRLDKPVHLDNTAGPQPVDVNRLAQATGLFDAAFRTTPSPLTDTRPSGKLGPRYRARYQLYGPAGTVVVVRQHLYPFATAGFVSYTPRGQPVYDRTAQRGWLVIADSPPTEPTSRIATQMLVALGVPDRHPSRTNAHA